MEVVAVDSSIDCYDTLMEFFGPSPSSDEVMHYLSEMVCTILSGEVTPCTELLMHHVNEKHEYMRI